MEKGGWVYIMASRYRGGMYAWGYLYEQWYLADQTPHPDQG